MREKLKRQRALKWSKETELGVIVSHEQNEMKSLKPGLI